MSDAQRIVNLADVPLKDSGNGKSFQSRIGRIGPMLGLTGLGCTLTVVAPGKRAYPFHRHHVSSELFYILSGNGEVRLDGRVMPIRPGDLIANPAGAEAHQIVNTGREELRYLAISEIGSVDIIDYPDSGEERRSLDRDLQGVRSRDARRLFRRRGARDSACGTRRSRLQIRRACGLGRAPSGRPIISRDFFNPPAIVGHSPGGKLHASVLPPDGGGTS